MRADFKYPRLRVEERFLTEEKAGRTGPKLLNRTVMVADHVLVSGIGRDAMEAAGLQVLGEVAPRSGMWRVAIPAERAQDLPGQLAAIGKVARVAEPDYLVFHQQVVPDDTNFDSLWGMRNSGQTGGTPGADVKATLAWQNQTGNADVVVAIIDSGVDYLHPDLALNIYQNQAETQNGADSDGNGYVDDVRGWNFYANTNNPMDDHFHGTHVAGTVGARGGNGLGVAGVAWNVKMIPLKFLSATGSGTTSDAIAAVRYSTDNGARISCNSWGGGGYSRLLEDTIRHAGETNSLFVAAAGNSANNNDLLPSYPASYDLPNIISVAATDHSDQIAWFSNYGAGNVHIAAPGVGITSTFPRVATAAMTLSNLPTDYARISGTSMATPHVAGAAALLLASEPSLTAAQLKGRILQRADYLPGLSGRVSSSARLNVGNLVDPEWLPTPANLAFEHLEWREMTGHANADGTAGAGERIECIVDLANRGDMTAETVVLSAQVVAGPATLVSPAQSSLGSLASYATHDGMQAALIEISAAARDLDEIVVRLEVAWQGGGMPVTTDVTIPVVRVSPVQASEEVDFSIGEMIRGPLPNTVFLLSPSAWRVMEFDTAAGAITRHAELDATGLAIDENLRSTGGLTTNADGTLLFAALTSTRQIQVFSLPHLVPLRTLVLDHEPNSLAVDTQGRLFTTSMDYWGALREVDVMDGRTINNHFKNIVNGRIYKGALLQTDAARGRLFLAETGLRTVNGPDFVHEWNVSGPVAAFVKEHPMVTEFLNDFALDEENKSLLTMHGGIYGVQVTSLDTGHYGEVWPLGSAYGVAVDVPTGANLVYAGSGAAYPESSAAIRNKPA